MALTKKEILSPVRLALLIVAALVFAGSVYGVIAAYRAVFLLPATINKPEAMYKYTQKGKIDYQVHLKPNKILTENPLGPGKSYYAKLVDHISLNYSYLFKGDQETSLAGTYSITATLEAKDMWQKDFVLVPPTSFTGKGNDFSFNKNYDLSLTPFQNYLSEANQELGVSAADPKVTVKLAINLQGDTPAGSLQGSLGPTMVIPLSQGRFKIDGNLADEKSDSISKTVTVTDPALGQKKSRLIYLAISTVVLGLLLAFLLLFSKSKPVPPVDQEAAIQKKYGARLVKVPGEIQLGDQVMVVSFASIDELVKVADELAKPIIKVNQATAGLVNYYVFDGQVVYKYLLARKNRAFQSTRADFPVSI